MYRQSPMFHILLNNIMTSYQDYNFIKLTTSFFKPKKYVKFSNKPPFVVQSLI